MHQLLWQSWSNARILLWWNLHRRDLLQWSGGQSYLPCLDLLNQFLNKKQLVCLQGGINWHEGFWLVFHSFGHAIRHRQEAADRELEAAKAWWSSSLQLGHVVMMISSFTTKMKSKKSKKLARWTDQKSRVLFGIIFSRRKGLKIKQFVEKVMSIRAYFLAQRSLCIKCTTSRYAIWVWPLRVTVENEGL